MWGYDGLPSSSPTTSRATSPRSRPMASSSSRPGRSPPRTSTRSRLICKEKLSAPERLRQVSSARNLHGCGRFLSQTLVESPGAMSAAAAAPAVSTAPAGPFPVNCRACARPTPGVVALADFKRRRRPRRDHRRGRRKWGRQVHPHENPRWGHPSPTAAPSKSTARPMPASASAARCRAGIAFVHQELNLFDNLDVAANVYRRPRADQGRLPQACRQRQAAQDRAALSRSARRELFAIDAGLRAFPRAAADGRDRQGAELSIRALVILDEPHLVAAHRRDREGARGDAPAQMPRASPSSSSRTASTKSSRVCDRVVVLRDGKMVGTLDKGQINHDAMVKLMVGRDLHASPTRRPRPAKGAVVLAAKDVRTIDLSAPPGVAGTPFR